MKRLSILLVLFLIFSCASVLKNEEYQITYTFLNNDDRSQSEKSIVVGVLERRLKKFTENVSVNLNDSDEILIRLEKGFDLEAINKIVLDKGKVDFWLCVEKDQALNSLYTASTVIQKNTEDNFRFNVSDYNKSKSPDHLLSLALKDTSRVNLFIKHIEKHLGFDEMFQNTKFLYGLPYNEMVDLYFVETNGREEALVSQRHIKEAYADYDALGRPSISIEMNEEGATRWENITAQAYKQRRHIAVTINDKVYSAPGVMVPIKTGRSQISSNFSLEEVQILVAILSGGSEIPQLKFEGMKKL